MNKTFAISGAGWDAIIKVAGRPLYYRLDANHNAIPASRDEGVRALEDTEARRVGSTEVGPARVSTVFLAIDHGYGDDPPILFETMIFGLADDREYRWRYSTWDQAVAGHEAVVAALRDGTELPE